MEKNKKEKKMFAGSKVSVASVTITSIILAVLMIFSIFSVVVLSAKPYETKDGQVNVYQVKSKIYTKAIVMAMPKSITGNDNGRKVEFFIEVNDDYKPSDEPVNQYRVYYYKDGKKLVAADGIYRGATEKMYPLVGFFIAGMNSLKKLKTISIIIVVVTVLATLGFLIYLLYLLWSVKMDRKYSASYQEQKRQKKLNEIK